MIISNIIGGLGNQMFQYAAGRMLSASNGLEFRLDVSDFASYRLHQGFELQRIFACPTAIAADDEVRDMLGWQSSSIIRRVLVRPVFSTFRRSAFVVEPHFHYWSGINNVGMDCYLTGYWQSEKYFRNFANTIRSDFTFKVPFNQYNSVIYEQIVGANAVSLHVRRGDYVNNPKAVATYASCTLDYYRRAIRHVVERVAQPTFFIFSDDPGWVKENIKIDFPCRYIDNNQGSESYNDMRLMSLCKHHIIANSSFSWWGAWLNPNPHKIVVAPKKWFANGNNIGDLFPDAWVKL